MRWLIIFFSVTVSVCLVVSVWGYSQFILPGPLKVEKTIVIPRGAGIERISIILARHNVVRIPLVLSVASRTVGAGMTLRAGEFSFGKHISPRSVMDILQNGKQVVRRFTIAEGLTNKEILIFSGCLMGIPVFGEVLKPVAMIVTHSFSPKFSS